VNAVQDASPRLASLAARPYGELVRNLLSATIGDEAAHRDVASAEYRRRDTDVALRLRQPVGEDFLKALRVSPYVENATAAEVFVNVVLSPAAVDLYSGWENHLSGVTAAVEHTSLVPCYPINLATLRSAIVGEQLRRCLSVLGARTSAHYWVEENARQLDLIRTSPPDRPVSWTGKADHVVGARFLSALNARAEDHAPVRTTLFRQVHTPSSTSAYETVRHDRGRGWLRDVLASHRHTLAQCGVRQLEFDFESEVYRNFRWRDYLGRAHQAEPRQIPLLSDPALCSESDLQYLERNVVYYGYLLDRHDLVLSVVPHRQRDVVKCASDLATEASKRLSGDLRTLLYGDVLINGRSDSMRDGVFHAVDDLLRAGTWPLEALRERFLKSRLTAAVTISPHPSPVTWTPLTISRSPDLECALLLDELPELLARFLQTGNYALVLGWTQEALSVVADHRSRVKCHRDLQLILGILR